MQMLIYLHSNLKKHALTKLLYSSVKDLCHQESKSLNKIQKHAIKLKKSSALTEPHALPQ